MVSVIAILLYSVAWAMLAHHAWRRNPLNVKHVLALISLGVLTHGVAVYFSLHTPQGYHFDIFRAASLIFWAVNVIVLFSNISKPLHNIFLLLLPFSVFAVGIHWQFDVPTKDASNLSLGIVAHILTSILAYAFITIASFHALLLAYQNHKLKSKQPLGVIGLLPPLQTMETLLFELVWAGEALLTLSLLSGFIFLEDMFAQHLAHKVILSIVAWLIYAILLFGRQVLGWGGMIAIKWTLGGFFALAAAYFGSKFVLELILTGAAGN